MRPRFALLSTALMVLSFEVSGNERLPHGGEAEATGNGLRAWYDQPTRRYDHGMLGDAIEGGGLVVLDKTGRRYEPLLPVDLSKDR